jgi:Esterase/lipase
MPRLHLTAVSSALALHAKRLPLFALLVLAPLVSLFSACNASSQESFHIWKSGAPGFEHLRNEPEQAKDWWVKNIHNPSITAFLPDPSVATGAAILVIPGGGHRELVFNAEGTDTAKILNPIGVAVFVLKYRLARAENSPYTLPLHAKQDAQRALRYIRSRAQEWGLDRNRVGVMGFSAGGEVASFIAYDGDEGQANATDSIERYSNKPDFQILVYPGPLGIPTNVPSDAPPAFLVAAIDDPCCSQSAITLLQAYKNANLSAEAHIYAKGGHAFNLGQRATDRSIQQWTERLVDWLIDSEITVKP